uniref:Uncharacterized protein n=1 Tax=Glossina austeni TaxID=7395 RepID=A0A1A9UZM0_GLOAU
MSPTFQDIERKCNTYNNNYNEQTKETTCHGQNLPENRFANICNICGCYVQNYKSGFSLVAKNIATSRHLGGTWIAIPIPVALPNIFICNMPWTVDTRCAWDICEL